MRGKLLAAAAAIVVLIVGSLALVAWLTRGGTALQAPLAAAPAPLAPEAAPGSPPAFRTDAPPAGASVAAPAPVDVNLPVPPRDSWLAVKAIAKPQQLGPLGRELVSGLEDFQSRLVRCTDPDVQARHGGQPVAGLDGADQQGPPSLLLLLETLDGEIRIVDAPVESRGGADEVFFACAQKVLRGQTITAPSARRGDRIRFMFPLPQ
jgi:hypothetical protein